MKKKGMLIIAIGGPPMGKGKKMTAKQDAAYDKKHGIKEGSKEDNKLDKERGVPFGKPKKGK